MAAPRCSAQGRAPSPNRLRGLVNNNRTPGRVERGDVACERLCLCLAGRAGLAARWHPLPLLARRRLRLKGAVPACRVPPRPQLCTRRRRQRRSEPGRARHRRPPPTPGSRARVDAFAAESAPPRVQHRRGLTGLVPHQAHREDRRHATAPGRLQLLAPPRAHPMERGKLGGGGQVRRQQRQVPPHFAHWYRGGAPGLVSPSPLTPASPHRFQ